MEHIQQIVRQLKVWRNKSAHESGFDIVLSPQNYLIFIVFDWFSSKTNLSSPLAKQFINSVKNDEFLPLSELKKIGKYLPFNVKNLSNKDFFNLSQELIQESLKDIERGNSFFTTTKINEVLVDLVNPSQNQIIYDPACGIGSTFVEIQKKYPNLNLKFIGQEINQLIYVLCQINLLINGIENAEIYNTDSIDKPFFYNESLFESSPLTRYKKRVNLAVSEPPFNLRGIQEVHDINKFIETMLSMINNEGRVIVVVPDTFLYSGRYENKRIEYLTYDWVEQVISLPETIFKPASLRKGSIVVFNKSKKNKGKIIFNGIDFQNIFKFEKTEVDSDAIVLTDLRANRYALQKRKELDNLFKTSPYAVVKISDVVSNSKLGRNNRPPYTQLPQTFEKLPYIRVIDLPKESDNSILDLTKIERTEPIYTNRNVVDFQAVLCSLIGMNLRPTIFNYEEKPIIIGSDLIAIKLNEKVNVDYFLSQLKSEYVRVQIESISSGASFNRISREDFLNLQIILPPSEKQTDLAIEFLKERQKELRQDISEEKREAKLAEYDIIRITVHDLNHKLGAMQNDLSALKTFLENNLSEYLQKPIKQVFEDDTEEEINQLRLINVLQRLINTRNEASAQLAATREELQNNTVRPKRANFKKWLENEAKPLYEDKIDFVVDGENIIFDFDENRFKNLVRNFVENAVQHSAKKVVFDLSYIYLGSKKQGKESVRILYKNDGDPFPDDFDFDLHFKGLYQKSSKSKGTGIGGYSINRTVELHNGEMNNVSPEKETFDLFPVQIELVLPIEFKSNETYVKSNPYTID